MRIGRVLRNTREDHTRAEQLLSRNRFVLRHNWKPICESPPAPTGLEAPSPCRPARTIARVCLRSEQAWVDGEQVQADDCASGKIVFGGNSGEEPPVCQHGMRHLLPDNQ